MRRLNIGALIVLLLLNISAFAGSIPEDLKGDDNALLYFGEVISCDENFRASQNGEVILGGEKQQAEGYVEIEVKTVLKGDAPKGRVAYTDVCLVGNFKLTVGEEYLIGYFDENNPAYVMETTSQNPRTLRIKHTDNNHMLERLEQYLNSGEVEAAERERLLKNNRTNAEPKLPKEPAKNDSGKLMLCVAAGLAVVAAVCGITFKGKRKDGKIKNQDTK